MMKNRYDLIVIGGGAAGFFAALAAKEAHPEASVAILEKSSSLLSKVRISGGGRCNVTHACFDPRLLVKHYPRGEKALIGPFTRFQPRDTMEWFNTRGVELKVESDNRVFPVSDNSQTIIDCLMKEAKKLGVEILLKQSVSVIKKENEGFELSIGTDQSLFCKRLILATGSHPQGHAFAKHFGHSVQEPVPSLFTFNVPTSPIKDLAGISVQQAIVKILDTPLIQTGPILITHWGFSGPAVLKLSAWGARILNEKKYHARMSINWIPEFSTEKAITFLSEFRTQNSNQIIGSSNPFDLPKNLWKRFLMLLTIDEKKRLSGIGNQSIRELCHQITQNIYQIDGKTTYKEEFVTCGGVALEEVNFKNMESRLCPGLFFAGEILDVDGITGGFNFQNAWTSGWLAGRG